jgi:hypothetical protein
VREYNDNGYNAKKDDLLKDNAFLNDKGFIDIVRKYLLEKELPQWDGSSLGGIA